MVTETTIKRRKYHAEYYQRNKAKITENRKGNPDAKKYRDEYYNKNKDRLAAQNKELHERYREEMLEYIDNYRAERGCCICGEKDFRCLVFHHREKGAKEFNIASYFRLNKKLLDEISKCDVMCANHHTILHYEETAGGKHTRRKNKNDSKLE